MFNVYDWKVKAKILDELDQIWGYDDGDSLWITQEDMNSLTAQYGSLANWNMEQQNLKFVESTEPNLNFIDSDNKTVVFSIRSSGLKYNREAFPNDSYEQAARKVAGLIQQHFKKTLDLKLNPYKDIEQKVFVANGSGVQHNYEVDTWHYWMLECLDKIMRAPS